MDRKAPPQYTQTQVASESESLDSPLSQRPAVQPTERYELMEEIGRGSMGIVYAAHDRQSEHRVAIKVLVSGEPPLRLTVASVSSSKPRSPRNFSIPEPHRSMNWANWQTAARLRQ